MAKKETVYYCEICNALYKEESGAVDCENTHYEPIGIAHFNYDDKKRQYPSDINVRLKTKHGKETVIKFYREQNKK